MLLLPVLIDGTRQGWLSGNSVPEQRNFLKKMRCEFLLSGHITSSEKSQIKFSCVFTEERGKTLSYIIWQGFLLPLKVPK